jgi:hypothetical protein
MIFTLNFLILSALCYYLHLKFKEQKETIQALDDYLDAIIERLTKNDVKLFDDKDVGEIIKGEVYLPSKDYDLKGRGEHDEIYD